MPRADPTRSDYCASRHLLRNLDNAAELRRNPLVRDVFHGRRGRAAPARRRDRTQRLERICDDVRASLARCSDHAAALHARRRLAACTPRCCDATSTTSRRPPSRPSSASRSGSCGANAARRTRRSRARFAPRRASRRRRRSATSRPCASRSGRAARARPGRARAVRLRVDRRGRAGPGAADRGALPRRRSGVRRAAARRRRRAPRRRADARCVRHARELDVDSCAQRTSTSISSRGCCAGTRRRQRDSRRSRRSRSCRPVDDRARYEGRRALFVRAAAAYAMQRWEVGDDEHGCGAVRRALDVMPHACTRADERTSRAHDGGRAAFRISRAARARLPTASVRIEQLAASHGHVRAMLAARAERIVSETALGRAPAGRAFDRHPGPVRSCRTPLHGAHVRVGGADRSAVSSRTSATSAASAQLAESLVPGTGRHRVGDALRARERGHRSAPVSTKREPLAESVYSDAERIGNGRLRGAAARSLAAIAFGCRRRAEAQRYIRESLALTERYGSPEALARATRARATARRRVNDRDLTYLSAKLGRDTAR